MVLCPPTRFACCAPPPLRQPPPASALSCPAPAPSPAPPVPHPAVPPAAPLNKGSSANLACHLNLLLERHDSGNATADGLLRSMYRAWRAVHNPQRWHPASKSEANWLASLRFIASVNTLMSNKWWAGLTSYSDLSAQEFAATVLQTSAQAGVQQAAAATATGSTTGSHARKLLLRYVPPKTDYPVTINWFTAGRVREGVGGWAPVALACMHPGRSSPATGTHLMSLCPCPPLLTSALPLPSYTNEQVLPQVSFQGQCASSWAFAAAAALESKLLIGAAANTTAAPSAQHIMVSQGGWWRVDEKVGQRMGGIKHCNAMLAFESRMLGCVRRHGWRHGCRSPARLRGESPAGTVLHTLLNPSPSSPSLLPSLQDCAASMSNYSAPACTGGSPADAFAFAAATGVVTEDGECRKGSKLSVATVTWHCIGC